MIKKDSVGAEFNLHDQFGRKVTLSQFRSKKHVLLLFYPLDFTPT